MPNEIIYPAGFFLSFILSAGVLAYWIRTIPDLTRKKKMFFLGGVSMGGIILGLSWFAGIWLSAGYSFFLILIFSLAMLLVGIFDDLREFRPALKFVLHAVLVLAYFFCGGKRILFHALPDAVNYILSFLWIVGITNAFNHLDIRDGLLGGITFIIGAALFFVSLYTGVGSMSFLFIFLLGALSAFMIFNLHPAKIYPGNAGSHFFGFILGTASMYLDYSRGAFWAAAGVPLLMFLVPVLDTGLLAIFRLRKGISVAVKTPDHLFFYGERKIGPFRTLGLFWVTALTSNIAAFIVFLAAQTRP